MKIKITFYHIIIFLLLLLQLVACTIFYKEKKNYQLISMEEKHELYLDDKFLSLWTNVDEGVRVNYSGVFNDEIKYSIEKDNFVVYRYYSDPQDKYVSYMLIDLEDGFVARPDIFDSTGEIKVWAPDESEYQVNWNGNKYETNFELEEICPLSTEQIVINVEESRQAYFTLLEKVICENYDKAKKNLIKRSIILGILMIVMMFGSLIKNKMVQAMNSYNEDKYEKIMRDYMQDIEEKKG